MPEDHLDLQAEIAVEQRHDFLRRVALGQRGEAADVGKQHRDLAALAGAVEAAVRDQFPDHVRVDEAREHRHRDRPAGQDQGPEQDRALVVAPDAGDLEDQRLGRV